MKLPDENVQPTLAAKFLQYLLQDLSRKVTKRSLLLLAFFLELVCRKYHVYSSTFRPKDALALWKKLLLKVQERVFEQYGGQNLPRYEAS